MKSIPLGIENFKAVIESSYYVDHTDIIGEIDSLPLTTAVLLLRPRRFGKSLMLSILQTFYETSPEERKNLFRGLKVMQKPQLMDAEANPVLFLRLKDIKSKDYRGFLIDFRNMAVEEYQRLKALWGESLTCPFLDEQASPLDEEEGLKNVPYQISKSLRFDSKTH